jgi:hypothetical protein
MNASAHRELGRYMGDALPPASAVVTNEVGAIKYYSRLNVVDMLGLTDETVSAIRFESFRTFGVGSSNWSVASVTDYLLERQPEAIILPAEAALELEVHEQRRGLRSARWGGIYDGAGHPLWREIAGDHRFNRYRPVMGIRIHRRKYLYLFTAPGIRLAVPPADRVEGRCLQAWTIDLQ